MRDSPLYTASEDPTVEESALSAPLSAPQSALPAAHSTLPTTVTEMDNGEMPVSTEPEASWPFHNEDVWTDVVLRVEDQLLYTSRSLLAYASPVFAAMFTNEFREKTDKLIPLPDKTYLAVSEMLAFLHPGVSLALNRDSAFRLLPLAEEYQIAVLKDACEKFLVKEIKNALFPYNSFLVPCLVAAEHAGLSDLQELCADRLSEPDTSLKELETRGEVELETKAKIYQMRIAKLEKEREDVDCWKQRVNVAKQRLRDIVLPHEEHCRCHVELKLRTYAQRSCTYCSRSWCSDNTSTEAYRNSYQFYCSHKIGYHISHDATLRMFMDMVDLASQ